MKKQSFIIFILFLLTQISFSQNRKFSLGLSSSLDYNNFPNNIAGNVKKINSNAINYSFGLAIRYNLNESFSFTSGLNFVTQTNNDLYNNFAFAASNNFDSLFFYSKINKEVVFLQMPLQLAYYPIKNKNRLNPYLFGGVLLGFVSLSTKYILVDNPSFPYKGGNESTSIDGLSSYRGGLGLDFYLNSKISIGLQGSLGKGSNSHTIWQFGFIGWYKL